MKRIIYNYIQKYITYIMRREKIEKIYKLEWI